MSPSTPINEGSQSHLATLPQFLTKNFGKYARPRGTWQIDPFGHSNTQAWLLSAEASPYPTALHHGGSDVTSCLGCRLAWRVCSGAAWTTRHRVARAAGPDLCVRAQDRNMRFNKQQNTSGFEWIWQVCSLPTSHYCASCVNDQARSLPTPTPGTTSGLLVQHCVHAGFQVPWQERPDLRW